MLALRTCTGLALVVLLGLAVRLPRLDYPLWLDEAWVANIVLAESWSSTLYSSHWLPLNPPLFLVWARLVTSLLGASSVSLHISSVLLGVAAIGCMAVLAGRLWGPVQATFAVVILAFSPMFILMSQQLKHYSADCAAAAAVLLAAKAYCDRPTGRRLLMLVFVSTGAACFSYTTAMLLPAVVSLIVIPGIIHLRDRRTALLHAIVFTTVLGLAEIIIYAIFLRRAGDATLNQYWIQGFATFTTPLEVVWFLADRVPKVLIHVPIPGELQAVWPTLGIVLAVAGTWSARKDLMAHGQRGFYVAVVFWTTLVTTIIVSLLSMYPLPGTFADSRLTLYFAPQTALMTVWALDNLIPGWVVGWSKRTIARAPRTISGMIAVGLVVFSILVAQKVAAKDYWAYEDLPSAIGYVRSKIALGERMYVHASVGEQARLELRLSGWLSPPVAFGDTGHPCCPQRKQLGMTNKNRDYIRADLANLFSNNPPDGIWALFASKDLLARDEKRFNEAGEVIIALKELGYQVRAEAAFESVLVMSLARVNTSNGGRLPAVSH